MNRLNFFWHSFTVFLDENKKVKIFLCCNPLEKDSFFSPLFFVLQNLTNKNIQKFGFEQKNFFSFSLCFFAFSCSDSQI